MITQMVCCYSIYKQKQHISYLFTINFKKDYQNVGMMWVAFLYSLKKGCVCVCVCVHERERMNEGLHGGNLLTVLGLPVRHWDMKKVHFHVIEGVGAVKVVAEYQHHPSQRNLGVHLPDSLTFNTSTLLHYFEYISIQKLTRVFILERFHPTENNFLPVSNTVV